MVLISINSKPESSSTTIPVISIISSWGFWGFWGSELTLIFFFSYGLDVLMNSGFSGNVSDTE
jgi:hypothetical protein